MRYNKTNTETGIIGHYWKYPQFRKYCTPPSASGNISATSGNNYQ